MTHLRRLRVRNQDRKGKEGVGGQEEAKELVKGDIGASHSLCPSSLTALTMVMRPGVVGLAQAQ